MAGATAAAGKAEVATVVGSVGPADGDRAGAPNRVKTSRYAWWSFVPANLREQFRRSANAYFLIMSILQILGWYTNLFDSPINPWGVAGTLLFVLGVTLVKDGVEDWRRHAADRRENTSPVTLWPSGEQVEKQALAPGDLVNVRDKEQFPADLVLVSTEASEQCFIETSNIDGETNLKIRRAPVGLTSAQDVQGFEVALPSKDIHNLSGLLELQSGDRVPVDESSFLLRGSMLRNTKSVVGLVVYAGEHTKIMQNRGENVAKLSRIERTINRLIVWVFLAQFVLVVVSVILWSTETRLSSEENGYVFPDWLVSFISFYVLYSNFVPISLYVSVEVVNLCQAGFLQQDLDLYDATQDLPAVCRNSTLCQELGQVEYIFSDKTGTLTCNVMKFKRCSIVPGGEADFWRLLALCHTVVINEEDGSFEAESPDEGALVAAAEGAGFVLQARTTTTMRVNGDEYQILAVNAFTSARKRMSVLLQRGDDFLLLCKGADNVLFELLEPGQDVAKMDADLVEFARHGLRTLVCAQRQLDAEEAKAWLKTFREAELAVNDRDAQLLACADAIEANLRLVGASAIEDRLQDEVPETLEALRAAGIKIWVLTGDKRETAVNIGYSSKLLETSMKVATIAGATTAEAAQELARLSEEPPHALVIDGATLTGVLENPDLRASLLRVGCACKVVIACRTSPAQKAEIVGMVRKGVPSRPLTLSIGDGANDVTMIQRAHVGVGISGLEGRQAVNAADFAIAEFRFLRKLLLVHGRQNYRRMGNVVLMCFYKNICLVFTLFIFSFWTKFSGTSLYDSYIYSGFNWFSGAPPLLMGAFDKDMSADFLLQTPQLYFSGPSEMYLNRTRIFQWIARAGVHALICALLPILMLLNFELPQDLTGLQAFGILVYTGVLLSVLLIMALQMHTFNGFHAFFFPGSIALFVVIVLMFSASKGYELFGVGQVVFTTGAYYVLAVILIPSAVGLIEFGSKSVRSQLRPTLIDLGEEVDGGRSDISPEEFRDILCKKHAIEVCKSSKQHGDGVTSDPGDSSGEHIEIAIS